jgi:predicted AlkP superfamily pyrophosphatase or phosphodiesterase
MTRWSRVLLLLLLLLLSTSPAAAAGDRGAESPRLVVLVVVDQLPAWVLPRVEPHFGAGGFRRLMHDGAWFTSAYYPQAATITAVGHATIATGAGPADHGIPGNVWFDRAADRELYCVADDTAHIVGGPGQGETRVSPRLLTATTFADECRIASRFRSKTVAVSAKDRSAILLAGHTGRAYWYSQKSGLFLSSSYYFPEGHLPDWAERFNAERPADGYLHQTWNPLLAAAAYDVPPDDRPFEIHHKGLGRTFPHVLGANLPVGPDFYKALSVAPQGSELLLRFARAAIAGEQLGTRDAMDVLCISLTAPDYTGHAFGPESIEYLDMLLQTDRQLAGFFADLDRTVGERRWLAVLTSDHGACPSPEYLREQGMDVGRVDPAELVKQADAALDAAFGPDDWLAPFNDPGLTIRVAPLRRYKTRSSDAQRVVADAVRHVPGVAHAFGAGDLSAGVHAAGLATRSAAATLHADRGPDVVVIPKPYWYLSRELHQHAAMHGTPYEYDAHVPVMFYGPGIVAGRRDQRVSLTGVAATLADFTGTPRPSASSGASFAPALSLRGK